MTEHISTSEGNPNPESLDTGQQLEQLFEATIFEAVESASEEYNDRWDRYERQYEEFEEEFDRYDSNPGPILSPPKEPSLPNLHIDKSKLLDQVEEVNGKSQTWKAIADSDKKRVKGDLGRISERIDGPLRRLQPEDQREEFDEETRRQIKENYGLDSFRQFGALKEVIDIINHG